MAGIQDFIELATQQLGTSEGWPSLRPAASCNSYRNKPPAVISRN